nr:lectin-like protein [uncultured Mediterranean phage uvMED]
MASTYIERTFGSTTNRRTFTYSVWVKRGADNAEHNILSAGNFSGNPYLDARFNANGTIEWYHYTTGYQFRLTTNRQFKDVNGWYHLVFATDTTQSTQSNRCKLYVNGVQETSFSNETYPSQDYDMGVNYSGYKTSFGSIRTNATFDGSMSHIHFIDGTAYDASAFGSTDATTGEWKINTSPSVTYGTNGFFILKDGNSVTDQSGNSNNFTVGGGTLTKTEDNPSNVFATLNPLDVTADDEGTYSNGNTTASGDASFHQFRSTFYLTTGKYYWEFKPTTVGDTCQGGVVGSNYAGGSGLRRNYDSNGQKYTDGSGSSYGATYTANDIIGVALDLDNGTLTFYKNGVSQGVAYTDMLSAIGQDGWTPDLILYNSTVNVNYGNGYFGTTAVASAGTNASGIGIFEYDVPTGFTALSTKGLNL